MCGSQHKSLAHHRCIPHITHRLVLVVSAKFWGSQFRHFERLNSVRLNQKSVCLFVSQSLWQKRYQTSKWGFWNWKNLEICSLVKTKEVFKLGRTTRDRQSYPLRKYYVVPRWRKQPRNKMQAIYLLVLIRVSTGLERFEQTPLQILISVRMNDCT